MIRTGLLASLLALHFAIPAHAGTASVTVQVPVGATLTINGQPTAQMTGTRLFVTPDLAAGPRYRYIFVATFTWNGEEVTKKKQLDVTVGSDYTIDMLAADPVPKPKVVEEPEVKPVVVPKVETPKPAPPRVEPRPAPKVETPKPAPAPKAEEPKPTPKPAPAPADKPTPKEPIAQPERQAAPKPREVKTKK